MEHSSFDLPAAIDVVDRNASMPTGAVNASEALAVPGINVLNRQNYAPGFCQFVPRLWGEVGVQGSAGFA